MDETYINDGFKGIKRTNGRKAREHIEGAQKRGLSEEKMYLHRPSSVWERNCAMG